MTKEEVNVRSLTTKQILLNLLRSTIAQYYETVKEPAQRFEQGERQQIKDMSILHFQGFLSWGTKRNQLNRSIILCHYNLNHNFRSL